jgi:butyrate kinase
LRLRTKNLVIAHLGGGITVAALKQGRAINVNHGLEEGPYTPERSGQLPLYAFMKLCRSGEYDEETLKKMVAGKGGLTSYCQTNSATEVEALIRSGSERFRLVYEGMAPDRRGDRRAGDEPRRQGRRLHPHRRARALRMLTDWITERVLVHRAGPPATRARRSQALALGGLRVMRGETARHYGFKFRRVRHLLLDEPRHLLARRAGDREKASAPPATASAPATTPSRSSTTTAGRARRRRARSPTSTASATSTSSTPSARR